MKYDDFVTSMDNWEDEFKTENPISYWIDRVLFKDVDGICDVAVHHFLFHPWILFEWSYERLKWAWQRVFRGWDDRVIWSIDWYLAEMIPAWVKKLKKDKHGIPISMFEESDWDEEKCEYIDGAMECAEIRYNKILDKIIDGFSLYEKMDSLPYSDESWIEMNREFEESFDLFKEYFGTLWD